MCCKCFTYCNVIATCLSIPLLIVFRTILNHEKSCDTSFYTLDGKRNIEYTWKDKQVHDIIHTAFLPVFKVYFKLYNMRRRKESGKSTMWGVF